MKKLTHAALLLNLLFAPTWAVATDDAGTFIVSPKQCTSLKQGDICYVDLAVSWHAPTTANYCLYADEQQLQCWQQTRAGQWQQSLTIKADTVISLKAGEQQLLYRHSIRYAWMHKKNNSNAMRWRLF